VCRRRHPEKREVSFPLRPKVARRRSLWGRGSDSLVLFSNWRGGGGEGRKGGPLYHLGSGIKKEKNMSLYLTSFPSLPEGVNIGRRLSSNEQKKEREEGKSPDLMRKGGKGEFVTLNYQAWLRKRRKKM